MRWPTKVLLSVLLAFVVAIAWPWKMTLLNDPYSIVLLDRNNNLLSAQIAADDQWRFPLPDSLPNTFVQCITTFEDKRFFSHFGVDPLAVGRAIRENLKAGKVVSGASTLSMQLVRMSRRNRPRTFKHKIIETFLALKLEARYSKMEILCMYAGHAPFGGNIVGLEAASWRLYNKDPSQLSWAEMATLCVLPNAPALIRLDKNRMLLEEKRNRLLHRLNAVGILSALETELALAEPLEPGLYSLPTLAPHYLEFLKSSGKYGRLQTSIDGHLQTRYIGLLNANYEALQQSEIHNAAIILIDNHTGAILAYNGNIEHTTEESSVDMILAKRSSGSILKPFLYAAAIDEALMTPTALLQDIPVYIDGFSPSNYDHDFAGVIPANEALSKSLNIPFVLLLKDYGVEKFRKLMAQLGLSTIDKYGDHYGLSLILGGAEVTLYELSLLYAKMANNLSASTYLYPDQNWTKYGETGLSLSAESLYFTFESMRELSRPNGHGHWDQFYSSRPVAWKTGTSYGHRDAWAIGVTPDYTLGVWVGNADGEGRDDIIGVSTAGKILFEALNFLPDTDIWFQAPVETTQYTDICAVSGMLRSPHCGLIDTVMLPKRSLFTAPCTYHTKLWTDKDGKWLVDRKCFGVEDMVQKSFLKLPPIVSQYYQGTMGESGNIPPKHPSCLSLSVGSVMEWKYPNANERVYIPRDFNAKKQALLAEVVHRNTNARIYWYLNNTYIGVTREIHQVQIDHFQDANHLYCVDEGGNEIYRTFYVTNEDP